MSDEHSAALRRLMFGSSADLETLTNKLRVFGEDDLHERERDALREGMSELAQRKQALEKNRRDTRSDAGGRAFEELRPLCAALENEAREAAKVIVRSFAGLSAIVWATKRVPPGLREMEEAVGGLRDSRLVKTGNAADVPEEIQDIIALLSEKGPAYHGGRQSTVQLHDPYEAAPLARAMSSAPATVVPEQRFYR